jgi:hypothetical protein
VESADLTTTSNTAMLQKQTSDITKQVLRNRNRFTTQTTNDVASETNV